MLQKNIVRKMEAPPLVSVIIPSFNHEIYVVEAINSVLEQTYRNIELVVIDDGSCDNSVSLLKALSEEMHFTFVSQANSGIPKTLNTAIRQYANGSLICILASDDIFHPSKVELQVRALLNTPDVEFCFAQAVEFDDRTKESLRYFPKKGMGPLEIKKLTFFQPFAAGSIMFTRNLYDRIGGFSEKLTYEDWDFCIRCRAETEFHFIPRPLFMYRSHSGNTMKTLSRWRIFKHKYRVLMKNRFIIPWPILMLSIALHFFHDNFYFLFSGVKKRFFSEFN